MTVPKALITEPSSPTSRGHSLLRLCPHFREPFPCAPRYARNLFSCYQSFEWFRYVYTRVRNRVALLLSRQSCGNRGIFPNRAKFVGHVLAVFQPVAISIITQTQILSAKNPVRDSAPTKRLACREITRTATPLGYYLALVVIVGDESRLKVKSL